MTPEERTAAAKRVIGEDRWNRLLQIQTDRLVLNRGMTPERARRYADALMDVLDPLTVLATGQVWSRPHTPEPGCGPAESYTVHGFTIAPINGQLMVDVGGASIALHLFRPLFLTEWPAEYTAEDERPQPPGDPIEEDPTHVGEEPEEEQFDPRAVPFFVRRVNEHGGGVGEDLPLLSAPYRAENYHKPEYPPAYGNLLDAPAYIAAHLGDFRAAWPGYRDGWDAKVGFFASFNELDGGCEADITVAAYIGWWLWQRVRNDVVTEYGGTVDNYRVFHPWAPRFADMVLAAAPWADPHWEIPPDHPLAQCAGQDGLFTPEVTS